MIGITIDQYHILDRLGEGGMAEVYKAVDLNLDREVAIKFLRTDPKNFEKSRKRFELEAKTLAKLDHPNIVRVLDYGDYQGRPYLVMEYIPGGNLKRRLGKPMPWKQACTLLIPIAEALQYAHEHHILHRDVKPSNILMKADGTPMLSDFGVAKMMEMDETMDLTGTSVGVGTPYYMAPEQGRNINVDHRVDMYSLGVVLYELITGRKPFQADTPMAVMLQHIQDPLPRPSEYETKIPKNLERLLFKALAKDPAQRFSSLDIFAENLKALLSGKRVHVKIDSSKRKTIYISAISIIVIGFVAFSLNKVGGLGSRLMLLLKPTTTSALPPTSTLVPIPSHTPTISYTKNPIKYGKLLFEENFDELPDGWDTNGNTLGSGQLIMGSKIDLVPFNGSSKPPIFSDYIFESQFTFPKNSYGIEFYTRVQYPPCPGWNCSIVIAIDRPYNNIVAYRWENGWHGSPIALVTIDPKKIQLQPDQLNRITIIASGEEYKAYINDYFIMKFDDGEYTSGTFILNNPGPTEIGIDYIRIYELP